jgi:hypothetical protein
VLAASTTASNMTRASYLTGISESHRSRSRRHDGSRGDRAAALGDGTVQDVGRHTPCRWRAPPYL